ncbi:MAG: tautomerase family protein [Candidatus Heimdallarchaeota archaeon]
MPIIHVHTWKGFDMDIPTRAVHIVIHESPKENWGIMGKPATESLKDEKPPE